MDEGSSNLEGNIGEQKEESTRLFENIHQHPEGISMVEEISFKSEIAPNASENCSKSEGCSLKMDIASPNSKMEIGSPKMDVISLKMEVVSPKMEATTNMDVSSPNMEVASPNMEEGSAKMEEVAVKMGEVSVKSEERGIAKDTTILEQGSMKMEEVAVKMGEVSVKADGCSRMIDDVSIDKGSVKMDEVSVKMEKVSVQSEQGSANNQVDFKSEESERKVQTYRGTTCVTEGEVPDWLTVDLLVRAIRNDKPGTKKPQIRPFGSPVTKSRAATHGHPAGKAQTARDHQMGVSFSSQLLNRPSGSHLMSEPSSSHAVARPSTSQSIGRPSTSESAGRPSTSQPVGKPSSSCLSDKPSSGSSESKVAAGQSKGKSGTGGRIKGKSSVSLHKGKASVSETSSRASGGLLEGRETGGAAEGGPSIGSSGSGSGTTPDGNSELMSTNRDSEGAVCDEMQKRTSVLERCASSDNQEIRDSDNIVRIASDSCLGEKFIDYNAESGASSSSQEGTFTNTLSESNTLSDLDKHEALEMFKRPTDPPKRTLKKPVLPLKGAIRKQADSSKETFKKPVDPPKRTLKKPTDSSKLFKKSSESQKVRFQKLEECLKDSEEKSSESSKCIFKDMEDSSKETFKKPFDPPKRAVKKVPVSPKKPKQPPLQVIRFISQRLSTGNTVYRVRATAVRGSVARDCHLVVKRCSNAAEVTYYKKVAPRIPYVPRVLLCEKNIVVMDDLVHEGFRRPRDQFTPAQMTVAIDGLARMHTASVVALKRDPSLLDAFPQAAKATESDIARDLRLLADRVKLWSLPDAEYYAARCRALAECVPYLLERLEPSDTNMTVLLHGNVSPRNVFFLYDSRNPRLPAMASFVDFANVYWGHPALDISLVTGRAGGFWEGYKIVLLSLLTRASGRMWMPQPEIKDCGETYAFALLRAVCSSVSGSAAKVLEARLQELFPVFRQYSWLDFW